ncbi:hypothetical protein ACROYT_G018964 [Oculina patagonica]
MASEWLQIRHKTQVSDTFEPAEERHDVHFSQKEGCEQFTINVAQFLNNVTSLLASRINKNTNPTDSASISGTSLEQRRWLVVGIALQNVLTPCLRDKIQNEMTPFYQHMVRNFGLDRQTYAAYQKAIPSSTMKLNYGSINNNAALHRNPRHYDYCVKDEVSLAKLFMQPFMAHFNAFDSSFDASAALAFLCGAAPFTAVKPIAKDVRSKVRNEWAHCDFTAWTEAFYDNCFDLMEALVNNLGLPPADKATIMNKLKLWRSQGLEICLGNDKLSLSRPHCGTVD